MIVLPGREIAASNRKLSVPRHHHLTPYAAVLLSGAYEEAGDSGRATVKPGMVILHDAFEGHLDNFGSSGAEILNIPLPASPPLWLAAVEDPEMLAKVAERDPLSAAQFLLGSLIALPIAHEDWTDFLAEMLRSETDPNISQFAAAAGLHPSAVSRGFRLRFGRSPKRYRLEVRAARAMRVARTRGMPLAAVAYRTGFADQAHMSRAVKSVFGGSPRQLLS